MASYSERLGEEGYVGEGLPLQCRIHDVIIHGKDPSDFSQCLEGGCQEPCGMRLSLWTCESEPLSSNRQGAQADIQMSAAMQQAAAVWLSMSAEVLLLS